MSSPQGMSPSLVGVLSYLHNALDAIDAFVLVYDTDEYFVACNKRCREFFSEVDHLLTPGHSLREILTGYYRAGGRLVPPGLSEDDYVAAGLARFLERDPARPVVRWGDRWVHSVRFPTSDGGMICMAYDVTAEKEKERALEESEERFRSLTELSSDWYWKQDENFRFTYLSSEVYQKSGYTAEAVIGKTRWEIPDTTPLSCTWAEHQAALAARKPFREFELRRRGEDGFVRYISISGTPVFGEDGRFKGYHGVGRDITERKVAEERLRESEEHFRALAEMSSDWYWEQDEHFRFTRASRGLEAAGLRFEVGKTRWELPVSDVTEEQWREHRALLEAHKPFRDFTYRVTNKHGEDRWLSISGEPVFDKQTRFCGYHGVGTDITARVTAEREIKRLAQFDFLTDLPNRTLFNDRLQQAITAAERHHQQFALLFIDLDRFRDVNNALGHSAGDELLRETARRFARCVRGCDTVCRQGGDEFLVLLPLIDDATAAARLAKRLLTEVAKPMQLRDTEIAVTASIGIALCPNDGADPATLTKNADAAMYHTKASGRNGFHFFTPAMHDQVSTRLAVERRLREAVDNHRIHLNYQPQFDIETGTITGVEALMRWRDPEAGEIAPTQFVPLAEETRLIVPLGAWALSEACSQCREWQTRDLPPLRMGMDISAVQFQRIDVVELVRQVLTDTPLPPSLLELEITEDVLLSDSSTVLQQLGALSHMGVRLALDHFGAGQIGLHHLKHFKVDRLKIDQRLVKDIAVDATDASIVAAITRLSSSMGVRVLAEGVETPAQRAMLAQLGCHEAQGDAFSPPLTPDAFEQLIAQSRSQESGVRCQMLEGRYRT